MAITTLTELVTSLGNNPTTLNKLIATDGTSVNTLRSNPIAKNLQNLPDVTVTPAASVSVIDSAGAVNIVSTADPALTDLTTRQAELSTRITEVRNYVDTSIASLVADAPGVLDTLNEIAASLGDDPNFAFSINSRLDSKANIQDPVFFGTVTTDSITIDNNVISTNITNASLELEASGTGQILAKSNLTVGFGGNLVVTSGNTYLNTLIPYTASGVNIQGSTSFTAGIVNFQSVSQTIVPLTGATGVVTHNLSNGAVFFHSSISANFTANFTNVPTTDDRGIGVALILDQGGTGYLPTAVEINGTKPILRWAYDTVPTPSSSQIDTVSFTLIRTGATWYVIGQHTNFA
jgi:hypothetical protein